VHGETASTSKFENGTKNITITSGFFYVNDESGSSVTNGDIFAVVLSHGPNGHGAFLPSGLRKNAGITNTAELDNCMCNSSGTADADSVVTVTMQRANQNSAAAANSFDDIVSYFTRDFFYTSNELTASQ
jgi:6-phosphogluconolactonase/glucosamine-6-phosphate isomerase/deaminase